MIFARRQSGCSWIHARANTHLVPGSRCPTFGHERHNVLPIHVCQQFHEPVPIQIGAIGKNGNAESSVRIESHHRSKAGTATRVLQIPS